MFHAIRGSTKLL